MPTLIQAPMNTMSEQREQWVSDLLRITPEGPRLPPEVHHIPELLELEVEAILERFKQGQQDDFRQVIGELDEADNPLAKEMAALRAAAGADNPIHRLPLFREGELERLFMELHEHVMEHPVWRHPFFVRIFQGRYTPEQLGGFALNYFNQVKNTRQCVALALGRFAGVMSLPYGNLNERISELTQIVLAQLLADEYGVGSHEIEEYPSLGGLFASTTHIVMYRRLFEGLNIPFAEQDVPLLPEVADNVLIQRIVAGDPRFSELEALASVGLGMEWGVPEFFTLLLGGMVRGAWEQQLPLNREQLSVFIAHVQYDVLHAISVMLVTGFFVHGEAEEGRVKQAVNMLMSGRYNMMSGLYRHIFGEACPGIDAIGLDKRYHIGDRRIEAALCEARAAVADGTVVDAAAYRDATNMPFVFTEGV